MVTKAYPFRNMTLEDFSSVLELIDSLVKKIEDDGTIPSQSDLRTKISDVKVGEIKQDFLTNVLWVKFFQLLE